MYCRRIKSVYIVEPRLDRNMPGRLIIAAAGFFAFAVFSTRAFGGVYRASDSFVGPSFYDGFDAVAIPDPTEGRVKYV
jgi:hypothetical protein